MFMSAHMLEMLVHIVGQLLWAEPSEFVDTTFATGRSSALAAEQPENDIFLKSDYGAQSRTPTSAHSAGVSHCCSVSGSQKRR